MRMVDLIHKKRLGQELSEEEIQYIVDGVTDGSIPDYQLSAFCMAVVFCSMTDRETALLTDAMARSGEEIDLSEFGSLSVDKHSTGGVGDKTSLILAPIVAACGAKLAKMSGRGLGHTGGTVDKLESIPGYRTELDDEEFLQQSRDIGICIIGQSAELAPADKRLYALRDVTATVDSIPLIVSSIMSKKLAAGAKNIVLDVTLGSGAFMKTAEDAAVLAEKMVSIGRACGRNTAAFLTGMDEPLGRAVGNNLEVKEAIAVLKGEMKGDVYEVSTALAGMMLALTFDMSYEDGLARAQETVASGAAYEKLKSWVAYQGGDVSCIEDPSRFPKAAFSREVRSPRAGYIAAMDTEGIGNVAGTLGAGRRTKTDPIDFAAGLLIEKKIGDRVEKGELLCSLFTEKEESLEEAEKAYLAALSFSSEPVKKPELIYKVIR